MVLTLTLQMGKQGPEMLGVAAWRSHSKSGVEPFRPGYTVPAVLLGCGCSPRQELGWWGPHGVRVTLFSPMQALSQPPDPPFNRPWA